MRAPRSPDQALHAQRIGKVFASATTWAKLVQASTKDQHVVSATC